MTRETLEQYSLVSLYSALAVLTLAMFGYVLYLARAAASQPEPAGAAVPELADVAVPVSAGADVGARLATEPVGRGVRAGWAGTSPDQPDGVGTDAARTGSVPMDPVGGSARGARRAAGPARMLTWLATLLVGASIILRGLSVNRPPLGNLHEFIAAASFVVLLGFSVWTLKRNVDWLGAFVTAPVLLMLGSATTFWYTEAAQLLPSLRSSWLVIHVSVATISVGVFTLAATVSLAYLLVDRSDRLPTAGTSRAARLRRVLPPAAELERLGYGLHVIAFPLWTFTLIAGAIWARQAWASYWNWDPKEVWTFVIWVVYAAYLHARATTGISRQKATYLALAGFACIILNYSIVNMYFVGQHSYSGV